MDSPASSTPADRLRRRILVTLGLASPLLLACSPAPGPGDDDEGGVTTDPSGDGSGSDEGNTSASTTATTVTTTATTAMDTADSSMDTADTADSSMDTADDGVKFDLPPEPDIPGQNTDCTLSNVEMTELEQSYPDCPLDPNTAPCPAQVVMGCVEPEAGQSCEDICPEGDCVGDWASCDWGVWDTGGTVCGPYEIDGACCSLTFELLCGIGRPFVVAGSSHSAPIRQGAARGQASPELRPKLRGRLVARWIEIARAEHASIASFARFGAELLALGAPPELIAACLRAGDDERRHAELCLTLARRWSARELDFGALELPDGPLFDPSESLAEVVEAAVREGCVGETLSALELAELAELVDDPELAACLRGIADDELRHAALAWRFVQWALERDPSLRGRVREAFEGCPLPEFGPEFGDDELTASTRAELRRRGWQSAAERRRCWAAGRRAVVEPCVRALLS